MAEPTPEEAREILEGLTDRFATHHNVTIIKEAVHTAVRLAVRYLPDRRLPDKAIAILDKACTDMAVQWTSAIPGEEPPAETEAPGVVTPAVVARVVSKWTGIPVAQLTQEERDRLLYMAEELQQQVIGQEEACARVAQAVQRARAGLKAPGRPIGVLLFLGAPGVARRS